MAGGVSSVLTGYSGFSIGRFSNAFFIFSIDSCRDFNTSSKRFICSKIDSGSCGLGPSEMSLCSLVSVGSFLGLLSEGLDLDGEYRWGLGTRGRGFNSRGFLSSFCSLPTFHMYLPRLGASNLTHRSRLDIKYLGEARGASSPVCFAVKLVEGDFSGLGTFFLSDGAVELTPGHPAEEIKFCGVNYW